MKKRSQELDVTSVKKCLTLAKEGCKMFGDVWAKIKRERESETAFQEALDSDRLTYDSSSYLWVYNFMYMGTHGGGPQFKHK